MSRALSIAVAITLAVVFATSEAHAVQLYCCQAVDDTVTPSLTNPAAPLCSGPQHPLCNDADTNPLENTYGGIWTATLWHTNPQYGPPNVCNCIDAAGNPTTPDVNGVCQGYCNDQPTPVPTATVVDTPTPPLPTATPSPSATATPLVFGHTLDHLECYKIKDSQKLRGVLHLAGPQFGLEKGCRVKGAKKLCVPVAKAVDPSKTTVDGLPWVESSPFGTASVCDGGGNDGQLCVTNGDCPGGTCATQSLPGQNLIDDYLCYQITCPSKGREPLITDQFGFRRVNVLKAYEVCAPARKFCHCEDSMVSYVTTCSPTEPKACAQHPGSTCVCQ